MSNVLTSLFPPGVAAVELRESGDVESLWPSEAACVSRAVPQRVQEFAAGRQCARRAMAEFGIRDFPLLMASDRRPLWPDTLTGSITHTRGFCAAAVAERARLGALGLDSEVAGDVAEHLWAGHLPAPGAGMARCAAAPGPRCRGDIALLREGGAVQVPIPAVRRTIGFSRCADCPHRVGAATRCVHPSPHPAGCHHRGCAGAARGPVRLP